MAKQVNLYEAKTNLSRLVEEAAEGKEIVIAKNGKPLARLVPAASKTRSRRLGASNHRFLEAVPREIADAEVAKEFEDSEIWPNT
ncbi:MAG TPA: type II toxin-antitoxin system prevent-host-death family antitoxin [Micropepsaceae bacterium]|jgi:prevent-host-death family protein|nr:type II toxin-antitoxin system prevent-host-death family antitoxin [Micropepsaceae bacterium]